MAIREVIRMGHPILRKKALPFKEEDIQSQETKGLIQDLKDTMDEYKGIGIAAPQIGVPKQLALIEIPEDSERYPDAPSSRFFIIFNPKIKVLEKELQGFWEGCLSVPGLRGFVERPIKIQVDYLNEEAKPQSIVLNDFLSTVFQHELDHLNGTLYVDKVKDPKLLMYEEEYVKYWLPQEEDES